MFAPARVFVGLASLAGAGVFGWLLVAAWRDSGAGLRAAAVLDWGLPCLAAAAVGLSEVVQAGRSPRGVRAE